MLSCLLSLHDLTFLFRFDADPYHKITVRIGDKMALICPRHGDGLGHDGKMFHKIYEVSKDAFE